METNKPILVSVCCLTYNQESYLRQCLDGILMQKTDFAFELLIHDDASTDNTATVIQEYAKKYPGIIKTICQKENQYSKDRRILARFVYPVCKGKYIALCEGDDYWTDPLKLQKQVDFLEANPSYGLVHTYFVGYNMQTEQFEEIQCKHALDYSFRQLLKANAIGTLTVMYRKEYCDRILEQEFINQNFLMGDYPLWLYIAAQTKIKFLEDCTAIYRIMPESLSHSQNVEKQRAFEKSILDIRTYFAEKYLGSSDVIVEDCVIYYRDQLKKAKRNQLKETGKEAFRYLKNNRRAKVNDYISYWRSQYRLINYLSTLTSRKK